MYDPADDGGEGLCGTRGSAAYRTVPAAEGALGALAKPSVNPGDGPAARRLVVLLASETYLPDVNGAARFVHRLACGLATRGHEVHVIAPRAHGGAEGAVHGFRVHRVDAWPIPGYPQVRFAAPLRTRRELRRVLAEIAPDVVHVHNHFFLGRAIIPEARRAAVAVVATNHFLPDNFTCFAAGLPGRVREALQLAMWRDLGAVYRGATLVTAPSSYAAALTERRALLRDVTPVSCGADLERFAFRPRQADRFRTAYELPERFSALHVGRLDPDKHVEELIDAVAIARDRIDAQLIVVGRGGRPGALERHARSSGVQDAVHFCGFVADELLPGAYSLADAYVHAGRAELQSISGLEAMAAGKPLLVSRAHALPLLVGEGENGWTHAPGDAAELAQQLVALHDDPGLRRRMGAASRARAARHAADTTVASFEALYDRAVARTAAPAATETRPSRHVAVAAVTGDVDGHY